MTLHATVATLSTPGPWPSVLGSGRAALEAVVPAYLAGQRWFGGKARHVAAVRVIDAPALGEDADAVRLALLEVSYGDGEPETYALPLAFAAGAAAERVLGAAPGAVLARLLAAGQEGVLHAAGEDPAVAASLAAAILANRRFRGDAGEVVAWSAGGLAHRAAALRAEAPAPVGAEQSNTSFRFGRAAILKLFRRTAAGPNPDLEVGAFLTDVAAFPHTPPLLGGVEYRPTDREPYALAILQGFVPNVGDAWSYLVGEVRDLLAAVGGPSAAPAPPLPTGGAERSQPPALRAVAARSLDAAALLGRRTAELHVALASHPEVDAFRPEPLVPADVRALHAAARAQADGALATLRGRLATLPDAVRARAERVLAAAPALQAGLDAALSPPPASWRTRTHGDYHLGQVLWTGGDFVVIDFEGEPARPLTARRAKNPPIRDVAGMIRSFHYAAFQALSGAGAGAAGLAGWARCWSGWAGAIFLDAYEEAWRAGSPLPDDDRGRRRLLDLFVAEKAFYELAYELNHRPGWVWLPLEGLLELAGVAAGGAP